MVFFARKTNDLHMAVGARQALSMNMIKIYDLYIFIVSGATFRCESVCLLTETDALRLSFALVW